ncbi:MAG: hypothetical protein RIS47_1978 [Bacteroidota bacterium]|jgi:uroporphyrinogen decarboxylase
MIFTDTLQGKYTERPPVWFMRQAGRVLPSYLKIREQYTFREMMELPEVAAEVTLLPIHDLGVDAAILFSDILVIPEALGMELVWTEKGPRFPNPLKDIENPSATFAHKPERLKHIFAAIDAIHRQKPDGTPLIGFCGAPFTTLCYMVQGLGTNHTFPDAVELVYKNKAEAHRLLEQITEMSIAYALQQIAHGIDAFQLFETHAGLMPEDLYFEVAMPYVRRIAAAVRATGTPFIFLPKGVGTGLARLTPDDADFVSIDWQTPLATARQMLNPLIGIQGNLDPRLLFAEQATIRATLETYLDFGRRNQNWIFNLGHGLVPGIPFENTKFVVDWVHEQQWV